MKIVVKDSERKSYELWEKEGAIVLLRIKTGP